MEEGNLYVYYGYSGQENNREYVIIWIKKKLKAR